MQKFAGNIRIGAAISLDIHDEHYSKGMPISRAWEMFTE